MRLAAVPWLQVTGSLEVAATDRCRALSIKQRSLKWLGTRFSGLHILSWLCISRHPGESND